MLPDSGHTYNETINVSLSINASSTFFSINNAWVNIGFPNSTASVINLTKYGDTFKWNTTLEVLSNNVGTYTIRFYVNDTMGSINIDSIYFYMYYDYSNITINQTYILQNMSANVSWLVNTSSTLINATVELIRPNGVTYKSLTYSDMSDVLYYQKNTNVYTGTLIDNFETSRWTSEVTGTGYDWRSSSAKYAGNYGGDSNLIGYSTTVSVTTTNHSSSNATYSFVINSLGLIINEGFRVSIGKSGYFPVWDVMFQTFQNTTNSSMSLFYLWNNGTWGDSYNVPNNVWHNVSLIVDKTEGKVYMYINKTLRSTSSTGGASGNYADVLNQVLVTRYTASQPTYVDNFYKCIGVDLSCGQYAPGLSDIELGKWTVKLNYTTLYSNETINTTLWVLDTLYPKISNISPINNTRVAQNEVVNITIKATHVSLIDTVILNVTYPDSTIKELNLTAYNFTLYTFFNSSYTADITEYFYSPIFGFGANWSNENITDDDPESFSFCADGEAGDSCYFWFNFTYYDNTNAYFSTKDYAGEEQNISIPRTCIFENSNNRVRLRVALYKVFPNYLRLGCWPDEITEIKLNDDESFDMGVDGGIPYVKIFYDFLEEKYNTSFTIPSINGTYNLLFWANNTLGYSNTTTSQLIVPLINYTLNINTSLLYNLDYSVITPQINYTTGNFTWNTTQYNISTYGTNNWLFKYTNHGNVPNNLQFKFNFSTYYKEWRCYNNINISNIMTNVSVVNPGDTLYFNCSLSLLNCSQTYIGWNRTINNCNLSVGYSFNITDTGG